MVYQIHIVLINICFKCFLMKDKLEFHPIVNKQFSYLASRVFVSLAIFLHWDTSRRGSIIAVFGSQFELESTQLYYHKLIYFIFENDIGYIGYVTGQYYIQVKIF